MSDKLNNEDHDEYIQTCSNCKNRFESWYYCTICDDFYLCLSCKEKSDHLHDMKYIWPIINWDPHSPIAKKFPSEVRLLLLRRCLLTFVHAYHCEDEDDCILQNQCKNMKRTFTHSLNCQRPGNSCPVRHHLGALFHFHSKFCRITKCLVPFCSAIKERMKNRGMSILQKT